MTKQDIEQFLEIRPAISKSALCREAGITPQYLNAILRDDRPMTDEVIEKITPVMHKYGFEKSIHNMDLLQEAFDAGFDSCANYERGNGEIEEFSDWYNRQVKKTS